MVRRWNQWKNPWDREYAKRGRLWRGTASIEPLPSVATPPGPLLEIGCGDGKFLRAVAAAGYDTLGVDSSRYALRFAADGMRARCLQGDARALPFRDGAFPIVVARYMIGALLDKPRRQAAQELARVTRRRGVLLVEDFGVEDFRFGNGREVEASTFERNEGILTHYFAEGEHAGLFGAAVEIVETAILRKVQRVGAKQEPRVARRSVFRRKG
ncbi:MAG TPA: class I SAM-dependent methyltransferase [Candidatus Thermoplasmatota archaeon]|nr:class I SAM-dependent methyltransferase [Candidatus Thermoplasmatota archaeon]